MLAQAQRERRVPKRRRVRITRESWSRKLRMEIRRRPESSALQRLKVRKKENQVKVGDRSPSLLCPSGIHYTEAFGSALQDPLTRHQVPPLDLSLKCLRVSRTAPLSRDRPLHLPPPTPAPSRPYTARTLPFTVKSFRTTSRWGSASGARDPWAMSASKGDGNDTRKAMKIQLRRHPHRLCVSGTL